MKIVLWGPASCPTRHPQRNQFLNLQGAASEVRNHTAGIFLRIGQNFQNRQLEEKSTFVWLFISTSMNEE